MCRPLNYFELFLVFVSVVSGCVSICAFASSIGVPVGIAGSAIGLKVCAIFVRIKKYTSSIKKKRKKHDKIALLAKAKLDTIKVFISKSLVDSYINHDEFVSVNNVLREYNEMNKEIKNPKNAVWNISNGTLLCQL